MKKAIFFLSFFFALGITAANAQCSSASASKSCCASKAAKVASSDASIEKRQADDGTISYVRKETDAEGNVKFVSVQYDEESKTFVNVAPKSATIAAEDKATATKKSAACSTSEKKSCCASGASAGKSCCASKAAKTSAPTPSQK